MNVIQAENRYVFEKNLSAFYDRCYENYIFNNIDAFIYQGIYDDVRTNVKMSKSNIYKVVLPHTLKEIKSNFCSDCKNLKYIDLSNVKHIGDNAFSGCTSLKSLNMYNVISIGENAFFGCKNLETISLSQVEDIHSTAFTNCNINMDIYLYNVRSEIVDYFTARGFNNIYVE